MAKKSRLEIIYKDDMNWALIRKQKVQSGKRKGKWSEVILGYYPRLGQAASAYCELRLKEASSFSPKMADRLEAIQAEIQHLEKTIKKVVKSAIKSRSRK